mgnify:CR=1 FL=1
MKKPSKRLKDAIIEYEQKQSNFKQVEKDFTQSKQDFKIVMDAYFANIEGNKISIETDSLKPSTITVTKVQRTSVNFDIPKLEKALGKKSSNKVIQKSYTIVDMPGLIEYLKQCGVSPKIFKQFISTNKSVNIQTLNQLEDIGAISMEQIEGSYDVIKFDPYYKVFKKELEGNEK